MRPATHCRIPGQIADFEQLIIFDAQQYQEKYNILNKKFAIALKMWISYINK